MYYQRVPREAIEIAHMPLPPKPPELPAPTLEERRGMALAALNAETARVIYARYPEHTQRNLTAAASLGQEGAEAAVKTAWTWINAVRARHNEIRAEIEQSDDPLSVAVGGWPEETP